MKVLSPRYNSLIEHYHQKNSALGPSELAEYILQFEGLDVSEDTLQRMCKWVLWDKVGNATVTSTVERRKLIISDLHAPFIVDGALEFCKALYKKYNCNSVVFIGDIVDGHAWSFHTPDVDGMSVGHELDAAIAQLKPWYEAFPHAKVTMGNHDELIARKAKANGLSKRFTKHLKEVIQAPAGWEFVEEFVEDGVLYTHGSLGNAFKRAKESRYSTVQGHLHSEASVQWSCSIKDRIFGMQLGCLVNHKSYAQAYGKDFTKKPIMAAGVVLENGKLPIVELMEL